MNATFLSREKNDVKFTMEFSADEFEQAQIDVYKDVKDHFEIPGFRRGKAPRSIIEKHYGVGIFFEDAVNDLLQDAYPQSLTQLELDVIDRPTLELSDLKKGEGFTATVTVPCEPIVEVKDYKGVEITRVDDTVKEEVVDARIHAMRERNARIVSVERPAKMDDIVLLDYSGFIGEEQFEGGTAEGAELRLGSGQFIPGFEEQLVGVSAGEDRDVTVTFPEAYHDEHVAGKEAVFHCKVHEVKEEQLPELDDEFAKDVSDFDTLDELRASIREEMEKASKEEALRRMKDAAIGRVVEATEVDIPPVMIEDEIDNLVQDMEQQLYYQGLTMDQYLEYMDMHMSDMREDCREEAIRYVKTRLVVDGIVAAEGIEPTEEEIDEEIARMAEMYETDAEKIRQNMGDRIRFIKRDIRSSKAIDLVYENAVILDAPPKEAGEADEAEAEEEAAETDGAAEGEVAEAAETTETAAEATEAPAADAPAAESPDVPAGTIKATEFWEAEIEAVPDDEPVV